jgi:hypothetical protein
VRVRVQPWATRALPCLVNMALEVGWLSYAPCPLSPRGAGGGGLPCYNLFRTKSRHCYRWSSKAPRLDRTGPGAFCIAYGKEAKRAPDEIIGEVSKHVDTLFI